MSYVTGHTRVAAVIGDPVSHSRSPAILNAAFAATGLDWVFAAFEVVEGRAGAAIEAMRTLALAGMSVTMPHKAAVTEHLDELTPAAAALGAVNCIAWEGGRLVGHNTDGAGLVASLRADGFDPAGSRVVVLGAGGAARAALVALHGAGASHLAVWNRSPRRAADAAALVPGAGVLDGPADGAELTAAVAGADLLVNATPLGMRPGDGSPLPSAALHPGLYVSDLVYDPPETTLMADAAAAGARVGNGIGMLVGQAAVAFGIWTGMDAPLGPMQSVARR